MDRKSLKSLETFMIRPAAAEFYQNLPEEDLKQLDGFTGFALVAAIEEMMMKKKCNVLFENLPASEKKKLGNLSAEKRYEILLDKCAQVEHAAYESERQMAKSTADYITKNATPQQLSLLAPYPHDLARRSIFFIEESEDRERGLLSDFVVGAGSWGFTTYSGKKLYTADEKAWVVLLALANMQNNRGIVDWHVVKGSIRSFLREAGLDESGHYTKRFLESIQAMHGGVFRFEGKDLVKTDGKPRKRPLKERIEGWHLISSYSIDSTTDRFVIVLDRGFIETFVKRFHMYSKIDIRKFCRQSPSAAALHRFFAGHTPGPDGLLRMRLFLVAKATNMLIDYPQELEEWPNAKVKGAKKRIINRALQRLIQDNTFGPRTCIKRRERGEDDIVIIDYGSPKESVTAKRKLASGMASSS